MVGSFFTANFLTIKYRSCSKEISQKLVFHPILVIKHLSSRSSQIKAIVSNEKKGVDEWENEVT